MLHGEMVKIIIPPVKDLRVWKKEGLTSVKFRDIVGKVVRLLRKPPAGGNEKIDDPFTNIAIWPGKRSVGHSAKENWTAITRHPHCACRWTRHYPEGPDVV